MMNQYARVGAPTIALMQRCQVIARYGVGVDIVDVEAATAQGHSGHQCPGLLHRGGRRPRNRAVADARAQARRVRPRHASRHLALAVGPAHSPLCADRRPASCPSARSARRSPTRAKAFGVDLLVYDPFIADEAVRQRTAPSRVGKDELLARSDVIFMQVPMTAETRHFLGPARVRRHASPGRSSSTPGAARPSTTRRSTMRLFRAASPAAGLDDPEEEPAKRAHWSAADNPLFSLPNVDRHAARRLLLGRIDPARARNGGERGRARADRRAPRNPVNNVSPAPARRRYVNEDRLMLKIVQRFRTPA